MRTMSSPCAPYRARRADVLLLVLHQVSDTDVLQQLLRRLEFHEESMPVGDLADKLMEMGFQVQGTEILMTSMHFEAISSFAQDTSPILRGQRTLFWQFLTLGLLVLSAQSGPSLPCCCAAVQVSKQEAIHLLQQMGLGDDNDQEVTKAQFLASQIDWKVHASLLEPPLPLLSGLRSAVDLGKRPRADATPEASLLWNPGETIPVLMAMRRSWRPSTLTSSWTRRKRFLTGLTKTNPGL